MLAEGIETAEHLRTARAFGATVGQGWYFGRPGPLPSPLPTFGAADKRLLIEISKQLEAGLRRRRQRDPACCVPGRLLHPTRRRYAGMVRSCSFVAALGRGMPAEPLPGLRGAVISPGDPLRGEWDIAVLGPHFAACLVARDLGDTGPDMTRRFEFILSHDRELTIRVTASRMSRVWPEPRTADLPQLPLPRGLLLPGPRPNPCPLPARCPAPPAARPLPGPGPCLPTGRPGSSARCPTACSNGPWTPPPPASRSPTCPGPTPH